ncbi:MAG: hypothetical protein ABR499_09140 [Gemmatimonadaceae bacterium]
MSRVARPARRRGRLILLALVVFLGFNVGVFPLAAARIGAHSRGARPLDLRFGYSPDTAYAAMGAYGAQGRRAYMWIELTADVVYPLAYALLLSLSVAYLFHRARPESAFGRRAAMLPVGALVADYFENVGIVVMLARYPERLDTLARVTSVVTSVKWVLFGASFAVLVVGVGAFLLARRRGEAVS